MTDMYADAVMTVILRAETDPMPRKSMNLCNLLMSD